MSYRIRYLPRAVANKKEIRAYLAQYYQNTAKKFFSLLKKRIEQLQEFPYSCPVYEDRPQYRKLVVQSYLVFYKVNEDSKTVEIQRIFPGSWEVERQFNDDAPTTERKPNA